MKLPRSTKSKITKNEHGENDQNSKLLEIKVKINITLIISQSVKYGKLYIIKLNQEIKYL